MIVFFADLDNTLIYSYKQDIGSEKRNVEVYEGREISFMTRRTHQLLLELKQKACIVPATTRTIEQYRRIDLGIGALKYALVCNGGVLLVDGRRDEAWYQQSKALTEKSLGQLHEAAEILEKDPGRKLEVRLIEELFVFTKCARPQEAVSKLKEHLDVSLADVFCNGEKVYVIPKQLDKGSAARRFQAYKNAGLTAAAGDSSFDLPMLEQADFAAAPSDFVCRDRLKGRNVCLMDPGRIFSETALEFVIRKCDAYKNINIENEIR